MKKMSTQCWTVFGHGNNCLTVKNYISWSENVSRRAKCCSIGSICSAYLINGTAGWKDFQKRRWKKGKGRSRKILFSPRQTTDTSTCGMNPYGLYHSCMQSWQYKHARGTMFTNCTTHCSNRGKGYMEKWKNIIYEYQFENWSHFSFMLFITYIVVTFMTQSVRLTELNPRNHWKTHLLGALHS